MPRLGFALQTWRQIQLLKSLRPRVRVRGVERSQAKVAQLAPAKPIRPPSWQLVPGPRALQVELRREPATPSRHKAPRQLCFARPAGSRLPVARRLRVA